MQGAAHNSCPRCGGCVREEDLLCPQCLLQAMVPGPGSCREEQIFRWALALPPARRRSYVEETTAGDAALRNAVLQLLQGFEESGEDAGGWAHTEAPGSPEDSGILETEVPGMQIGHFRLLRSVGEGGMGAVWMAEQTSPVRRTVALKLIKLGMDTREVVKRFEQERQVLALLNHPNIAQVFEAGATHLGRPYFAMEFAQGMPITQYCHEAGMDIAGRIALFRDVCAAVEHAHQKGVIHRDLKPSNILVANGVVKVIDFGVAKATQESGGAQLLTQQSQVLGTPAYMSPEQARTGGADIDTRADVYSLGVLLYELLTGRLPIDPGRLSHTTLAEMQRILLEEEPPLPSVRLATVQRELANVGGREERDGVSLRGDLDWIVMKAIRKERSERYASAAALSEDLRRHLVGEPVSAAPPTWGYRTGKFIRRNRVAVTAGCVVVAAMVAGTATSVWQAIRASRAERAATRTLSDMYARSGLAAASKDDAATAALWFANAAVIAGDDTNRVMANGSRAEAWGRNVMLPVRAIEIPQHASPVLAWNPKHPVICIRMHRGAQTTVWDLESDRVWQPPGGLKLGHAAWAWDGAELGGLDGEEVVRLAYPSGREKERRKSGSVRFLEYSPDGRWLAVGSSAPFLWDLATGDHRPISPVPHPPSHFRFNRSGHGFLIQWEHWVAAGDSESGQLRFEPVENVGGAAVDFLGEGALFFCAGEDGVTHVRDSNTGRMRESIPRTDLVPRGTPADASPDGRWVARSNGPMIDRTTHASALVPFHDNVMTAVRFSADGKWLASGSADHMVKLWAIPEGRGVREVGRHQSTVQRLEFSPDSSLLATCQEGLVRVWRIVRSPVVRSLDFAGRSLMALGADGIHGIIAPWSRKGGETRSPLRLVHTETGAAAGPEFQVEGNAVAAAFGPGDEWVALAVITTPDRERVNLGREPGTGQLQVWDARRGILVAAPIELPSEPRDVAVDPSGTRVALYCNGGTGVELEVGSWRSAVVTSGNAYSDGRQTLQNGRCRYSPDGRLLVLLGPTHTARVWDRDAGRLWSGSAGLAGAGFDVDFIGDRMGLVVWDQQSRVEIRDTRTGHLLAPPIQYSGWPFLGRFGEDGERFLTTGRNRVGEIWDWRAGERVCPVLPHDHEVMSGVFLPGRPWVVTGGHDGWVKIWDPRSGMLMAPPLSGAGWVLGLAAPKDTGRLLASRSLAGRIDVIDLNAWVPAPSLDLHSARLLAEIHASAQVHPGGDLVPLSAAEWMQRWNAFRSRHPDYPAHRVGTPEASKP